MVGLPYRMSALSAVLLAATKPRLWHNIRVGHRPSRADFARRRAMDVPTKTLPLRQGAAFSTTTALSGTAYSTEALSFLLLSALCRPVICRREFQEK